MTLISIDGVALPTPSEYSVGIYDVSKAERNANGNMIIERITTKQKIQISYAYLSADDLFTVLNAISPVFYNVTYIDPSTNSERISSFYCGDRNMGLVSFVDGIPKYTGISFNLIER